MSPSRSLVPLVAAALAGTATLAVPAVAHAAPAASAFSATRSALLPTLLTDAVPTWARTATVLGATPADQTVYVNLALAGKDPAGEKAYGAAASTPGNALYRQWLTKDQFEQRFGALPGAADAVTKALKALGVNDVQTDAMGLGVLATMPASVAASVFQTSFHQLSHAGESLRVPVTTPTLPASLRP